MHKCINACTHCNQSAHVCSNYVTSNIRSQVDSRCGVTQTGTHVHTYLQIQYMYSCSPHSPHLPNLLTKLCICVFFCACPNHPTSGHSPWLECVYTSVYVCMSTWIVTWDYIGVHMFVHNSVKGVEQMWELDGYAHMY